MSANRPDNDTPNTTTGTTGTGSSSTTGTGAGTSGTPSGGSSFGIPGSPEAGTTRESSAGSLARGSSTTSTGGGAGAATAPATGIAGTAQQYGQKIAEGATRAKDYVSEKAGVVGEKFQDLRNKDYGQMAEDAKQYARQNPGQALLISAAAGFLLGILLRGSRR